LAAGIAAAVALVHRFDHDVWLVAYLFLVGFLAQGLLRRTQVQLPASGRERPGPGFSARMEPMLWSGGVALVPAGVLVEARALVVFGSGLLLVALAGLWRDGAQAPIVGSRVRRARLRLVCHRVLIISMAGSVAAGTALAWDTAWW
jgi:hypothetical protein